MKIKKNISEKDFEKFFQNWVDISDTLLSNKSSKRIQNLIKDISPHNFNTCCGEIIHTLLCDLRNEFNKAKQSKDTSFPKCSG